MKGLVIFGATEMAQLANFYFARDNAREIAAFTVDKEHNRGGRFCDREVVDFEDVASKYPPEDFEMFIAIGPKQMNRAREAKVVEAKTLGYKLASYVSPSAVCHSALGENCFVADYAVVNPFATVGNNCFILEHALVANESSVGNNCYISPQVSVGTYARIGDNSFLGTSSVVNTRVVVGNSCLVGAMCYISADTEESSIYGQRQSLFLGKGSERIDVSSLGSS